MAERRPPIRVATREDLDGVTGTLAAAFAADPLWSWAFPDPGGLEELWRLLIGSALRYPWVFVSGDYEAASVWIPDGGIELEDEEEPLLEQLLVRRLGDRAGEIGELFSRFDAAHPRERPHHYLSLLGTRPDRRGSGIGLALLAENLERVDADGVGAYLEASNPANVRLYERFGFAEVGAFETPDGARRVPTMWRGPS